MERLTATIREGTEITGLSRTKLSELLLNGSIRSLKVGRRRLIPLSALRDWIEGNSK